MSKPFFKYLHMKYEPIVTKEKKMDIINVRIASTDMMEQIMYIHFLHWNLPLNITTAETIKSKTVTIVIAAII